MSSCPPTFPSPGRRSGTAGACRRGTPPSAPRTSRSSLSSRSGPPRRDVADATPTDPPSPREAGRAPPVARRRCGSSPGASAGAAPASSTSSVTHRSAASSASAATAPGAGAKARLPRGRAPRISPGGGLPAGGGTPDPPSSAPISGCSRSFLKAIMSRSAGRESPHRERFRKKRSGSAARAAAASAASRHSCSCGEGRKSSESRTRQRPVSSTPIPRRRSRIELNAAVSGWRRGTAVRGPLSRSRWRSRTGPGSRRTRD